MRRSDKEIKDGNIFELILKKAEVCRIALCDDGKPYIIPMNSGLKITVYIYIPHQKGVKLIF